MDSPCSLGSTCNHVAAMLFKLDYFWRQGYTNKACTEKPCAWNKYGERSKASVEPVKVENLSIRKPKCGKSFSGAGLSKRTCQFKDVTPFSFRELHDALSVCCPDAVVFQGQATVSPQDVFTVEVETSPRKPLSELLCNCKSVDEAMSVLGSFTDEDVNIVERTTRGQAYNELWKLQRVCRVTASIVHDVYTRVQTLQDPSSKRSKDPTAMLNTIMKVNNTDCSKVPQLKYGREMEAEARSQYRIIQKEKHQGLRVDEVGLVISRNKPHYGASADGVVSCSCCGTGVLEIKCPLSVAHTAPSVENLPFLSKDDSSVRLSKSSKYYSQVQWQMGICQRQWCDFFVYSRHGYYLERIVFDRSHFMLLMSNSDKFYMDFVVPGILHRKGAPNLG